MELSNWKRTHMGVRIWDTPVHLVQGAHALVLEDGVVVHHPLVEAKAQCLRVCPEHGHDNIRCWWMLDQQELVCNRAERLMMHQWVIHKISHIAYFKIIFCTEEEKLLAITTKNICEQ